MLTLECVPAELAEVITKKLTIPTIGIGAGAGCDGQVLVYQDMLGMFSDFTPKFAKKFEDVGSLMKSGFQKYIEETKSGIFPSVEHTFRIDSEVIAKIREKYKTEDRKNENRQDS